MEDYKKKVFDDYLNYAEIFASKYEGLGLSHDELVLLAYEGLFICVKNYKFYEYFQSKQFHDNLTIHLYAHISRAIINKHCITSFFGQKYLSDIMKILRAYRSGCDCLEDVQEMTSLSMERINECITFMTDDTFDLDGYALLASNDEFQDNIHNKIYASKIADYLLNSNLRDIEKEVIKLRFGFYGRVYSLTECGEILGKHRQIIFALEKNLIKKIRKILLEEGLIEESDIKVEKEYIRKFYA